MPTVTLTGITKHYDDLDRLHRSGDLPAVIYTLGKTFAVSTAYKVGQLIVAADTAATPYVYRVTVAGTSHSAPPTYPTVIGNTVVSGTMTIQNIGRIATEYWIDGLQSRPQASGPAYNGPYGEEAYMLKGRLHRTDGPAVTYKNAAGTVLRTEYWVDGKRIPDETYALVRAIVEAEDA